MPPKKTFHGKKEKVTCTPVNAVLATQTRPC